MGDQNKLLPERPWGRRVLLGVDNLVHVLTGGENDETISARSQSTAYRGSWAEKSMAWWLTKIQPVHGKRAEKCDEDRAERIEQIAARDLGQGPV